MRCSCIKRNFQLTANGCAYALISYIVYGFILSAKLELITHQHSVTGTNGSTTMLSMTWVLLFGERHDNNKKLGGKTGWQWQTSTQPIRYIFKFHYNDSILAVYLSFDSLCWYFRSSGLWDSGLMSSLYTTCFNSVANITVVCFPCWLADFDWLRLLALISIFTFDIIWYEI